MRRSSGKHPLPLWKLWPSKLAAQSPTQPEIIWKNQTQEKQSKGNTPFNGHINCKDEKCMCKHLVEAVKKREPGKMLPEKKYSLEINSRELSTLRRAKCLIDSCFFVCLFFTFLFQIFSSSTALCPSTDFQNTNSCMWEVFLHFNQLLYLQLGRSRKGGQCHSTCRYEYCYFYLKSVYSLTENHVMQQTYKKAGILVKKLGVTKESQRKTRTMLVTAYILNSS